MLHHEDMGNPGDHGGWAMYYAFGDPTSGLPNQPPTHPNVRATDPANGTISLSTVKVTHPPSFNILQLSEGTKPFSLTS